MGMFVGMFRTTIYEISTTKPIEELNDDEEFEEAPDTLTMKVNGCILTALKAEITYEYLKSVGFNWGKHLKLKDPHSWSTLPTDGYWRGYIKHDACGMNLRLIYHFPNEFENTNSVALHLIWDRPGIKSKLFPASEVNSMIDTWQSAIEKEIKAAGLVLKKRC
jgi:hypothetical protein